jgi:predicted lysophospholipase L1 biosynthesis ABC-type transport system permease subunit
VPAAERKGELDGWLEGSVASARTSVHTYGAEWREYEEVVRLIMVLFAAVESTIAIVAAVALAALNYIFFAQRREEFGILHAIGHSRPWLVFRTAKETGSAVGLAWLIGAAICLLGLIGFQALVYTPRGLNLDLFSFAPWMFTLPIPVTVIVVGAGTIARTLRRLDPVAVIEMR